MASLIIFTRFVATRVLHTAGISHVESTVCYSEEKENVPPFLFLSEILKIYHLSFLTITQRLTLLN